MPVLVNNGIPAQGPSSIALLSSYADSDQSDTDDEDVQVVQQKSKLKRVT